jgi:hypothetical protein
VSPSATTLKELNESENKANKKKTGQGSTEEEEEEEDEDEEDEDEEDEEGTVLSLADAFENLYLMSSPHPQQVQQSTCLFTPPPWGVVISLHKAAVISSLCATIGLATVLSSSSFTCLHSYLYTNGSSKPSSGFGCWPAVRRLYILLLIWQILGGGRDKTVSLQVCCQPPVPGKEPCPN